jgi:hypothetical protein
VSPPMVLKRSINAFLPCIVGNLKRRMTHTEANPRGMHSWSDAQGLTGREEYRTHLG